MDRSSSQRNASSSSQPAAPIVRPPPNVNLFDDDIPTPPVRPNTTDSQSTRPPPAKPTNHSQLLGGLDFLGEPPDRPASASSKPQGFTGPSRPDLKQSILSLYASAPRSQPQQSTSPHARQGSFGGMQSPPAQQSSAFGGLDDAFAGLNFSNPTSSPAPQVQQKPAASSFASFGQASSQRSAPAPPQVTSTPLGGGGFFDTSPKPPPKPVPSTKTTSAPPQALRKVSNASSGFGEFSSALNPISASSMTTSTNGLLDLSSPQSITSSKPTNPSGNATSVFNLSAPKPASQYQQIVQSSAPPTQSNFSSFSNTDAWGSNDAWAIAEPTAPTPQAKSMKTPTSASATASDFGWGSSTTSNKNGMSNTIKSPATTSDFGWGNAPSSTSGPGDFSGNGFNMPSPAKGFGAETPIAPPTITADEDFGGWNSAAPETPAASVPSAVKNSNSSQAGKSGGGFAASEDLWSNVWQ